MSTKIARTDIVIRSEQDNLAIMPWTLMHEGYDVTYQETVVSVDPDSGIPITHSRFTTGGRIISAKIYVDSEPEFWIWYHRAVRDRALPCWVLDSNIDSFMKCIIMEQPSISRAGTSVNGCFVQLKLYARSVTIPIDSFITENMPENYVTEDDDNYLYESSEVLY